MNLLQLERPRTSSEPAGDTNFDVQAGTACKDGSNCEWEACARLGGCQWGNPYAELPITLGEGADTSSADPMPVRCRNVHGCSSEACEKDGYCQDVSSLAEQATPPTTEIAPRVHCAAALVMPTEVTVPALA